MINTMMSIKTTQIDYQGKEDTMELVTEAKVYNKNNCTYLVYEESEIAGMKGTTTTIKMNSEKVSIKRFGKNMSEMIFEKGKRFKTRYKTAHGDLGMELITRKIEFDEGEKINLNLEYDINITNLFEGRNIINITTK